MSGLLDDLVGAVGAVTATAAPAQNPAAPQQPSVEDRLATVENFVITWGPILEKLAPLLAKLEAL